MKYRCIFCWLGEIGRKRIDKSKKPEKVGSRREIRTEKVGKRREWERRNRKRENDLSSVIWIFSKYI
jgi:wyosine [tRNA(Phe)-imidazoG37] synthetase (radical SAM superfamily)